MKYFKMSRSSARLATKQVIKREVVNPEDKPSKKSTTGRSKTSWTEDVSSKEVFPDNFMEEDDHDMIEDEEELITGSESDEAVKTRSPVKPLTPVSPIEKKKLLSSPNKSRNRHAIDPDKLPIPCCSSRGPEVKEEAMEIPEPDPLVVETKEEVLLARKKLDNVLNKMVKIRTDGFISLNEEDSNRGRRVKPKAKPFKDDMEEKHPSLVLKLFDRSVDLAKFSSKTPLYPVVRAWIRDLKNNQDGHQVEETKKGPGVYSLPRPLPKEETRIPCKKTRLTISEIDYEMQRTDYDATKVFAEQLQRWKVVRKEWTEAALKNESRYKHSCDVLKAMFDKTNSDNALIQPKLEPNDSF